MSALHRYTIRRKARWYVLDRKGNPVPFARVVMEDRIGRPLRSAEVVDHVNGDSTDDRIENLRLFASHADHMREEFRRQRLRGLALGPKAPHAPRERCNNGHFYLEHGYVTASGRRSCRACRRVRERRKRLRAKSQ